MPRIRSFGPSQHTGAIQEGPNGRRWGAGERLLQKWGQGQAWGLLLFIVLSRMLWALSGEKVQWEKEALLLSISRLCKKRFPHLPVILCTGHSDLVSREKVLGLGIKQYITKPIAGDELFRAVRSVLDEK
ncbi:MAG: response regulator [Desulfobulbaceae bacterium]|nr:response regulator [Desulfobulbaceae bacterium]